MTTSSPPTVVGLDLSLTAAGIATPHGLHTVGEKGKAGATLTERRQRINRQVSRVLDVAFGPAGYPAESGTTIVAIEAPTPSRTVGQQHDRSGLWWRIVCELTSWPLVDVVEVGNSARAKYATGKGNAGKDQVLAAVVRRYPDQPVADNDQADALVLRAMALDHYGHPLADVPAAHRAALASVDWPQL